MMIDEIANRNQPPRIIGTIGESGGPLPLFPEDYDWEEQTRIKKAVKRLGREKSVALWEELIKHANDSRYSLTTADIAEYGNNRSVGYFCYRIADLQLRAAFSRHLIKHPTVPGRRIYLDLGIGDLVKWRQDRTAKQLYELQIELCEKALKLLPMNEDSSDNEKKVMHNKISSELEQLRKTKHAVLLEVGILGAFEDTYTEEGAKWAREKLKQRESVKK